MPRNGSGVYTVPNGTLGSPSTTISSSAYDTFLGDISTEMTNSVNVQGTAPMLAPFNAGGFKITNVADPTAPQNAATKNYVDQVVPSGSVFFFAASAPPTGYLECNGASVATATYPTLFAVTGYLYGGAGANFNLPDLRGKFIRGWDDGRGVDTGRVFGSPQADIVGPHAHNMTDPTHTHTISQSQHAHTVFDPGHAHQLNANTNRQAVGAGSDAFGSFSGGTGTTSNLTGITLGAANANVTNNAAATGVTTQTTGSGLDTETRVKNVALLPCIKT